MKKLLIIAGAALAVVVVGVLIYAWLDCGRHPDKLWLHRCNSIEKLHEKRDAYPNVETDIIYRGGGIFDVSHDADTSFNLRLDSFFAEMSSHDGRMWLDMKTLTPENAESALCSLDSLIEAYGIDRSRFIIESPCTEALRRFREGGWYTSYYVAFDKPSDLSRKEKTEVLDSLRKVSDSGCADAISFPGWWYSEISANLDRDIDLLTWKHRTTQFALLLTPEGRRMLADPRLKVILIKSKGRYHR